MARINLRYTSIFSFLALFGLAVFVRYGQLAFSAGPGADSTSPTEGERGSIVDRNGRVLAMDIPKYDISLWKPSTDPEKFPGEIPSLAALTGLDSKTIAEKYADPTQNYFYLAKRLSDEQVEPLREAQKEGAYRGVQIEEISGRLYPEGTLASALLGFTGEGNAGLDGIETKYEDSLRPKPRSSSDGTDRLLDPEDAKPKGDKVVLTIDANLQFLMEKILTQAVARNSAEAAIGLAMDVRTGELLSYVSLPGFDPNRYGEYSPERRRDLISLYAYEPGSVFKVFSMASILDLGGITPATVFNCDGAYRKTLPSGEKIVIKDLGVYGPQNLAGILALSSNAGVGYASDRVSNEDLEARLKAFGFGARTGTALSGESPGSMRPVASWSARSKPTIAIGQEVQVTALQMIAAAGAIGNLGVPLKPATVKRIESADGQVLFEHKPQELKRVVSEATARSILAAMESAAGMSGTGWRAGISDVRMAVKTGTAQMIDQKTRAYSDTDYIASTLGIFPADNPRIAVYIALIKPRGASYLGGQIAAPVLKEAAEAVLSTFDLERGKSPTIVHPGAVVLAPEKEAKIESSMPDLSGYSKKALLPLVGRRDLRVVIEGEGYVVSQEPAPGTPVTDGMRVVLRLR